MARKRKIKPPPDEKRCTYVITKGKSAGKRCPNAKQKGRDFCNMHPPELARKMGKKGGEANKQNWDRLKEIASRWPIGQSWANQITFGEAMVGECLERGDKSGRSEAMAWNNQLIRAMDARDRYKATGKLIAFFHQTNVAGQTAYPEAKGERPEPTPCDGGEQGFVPPEREGEG